MSAIGMNVDATGRHDAASLRALNCTWARIVARRWNDVSWLLAEYRSNGISVLLTLDRMSIEEYGPVDPNGIQASSYAACRDYLSRYGQYVTAWQPGNEPDHESPSSWTMTVVDFTRFGRACRQALPGRLIVSGGLVSGHPDWLAGADLGWCDAIAIHPYLRDAPNPNDLEDIPDVDVLVREYAALGKQVWISEWGWWGDDQNRGAEEVRDMIGWAASNRDVGVFTYFCMDDAMVPPFGLYDDQGGAKLATPYFRSQAAGAFPVALPTPGGVVVVPPVQPPVTEPIDPRVEAYRYLWQAFDPGLSWDTTMMEFAIPKFWREHISEMGSPLGPELPEEGGTVLQTFTRGIWRWTGAAVEKVA